MKMTLFNSIMLLENAQGIKDFRIFQMVENFIVLSSRKHHGGLSTKYNIAADTNFADH